MENIGDWLYIIFLIIAVVSGMRSSKKRKEKSLEKEIFDYPQEETSPESQEDPVTEAPLVETHEIKKEVPPPPRKEPKTPKEEQPNEWFNEPEDLRKAIIYTEILNRKY